jgi:hypothetical protein
VYHCSSGKILFHGCHSLLASSLESAVLRDVLSLVWCFLVGEKSSLFGSSTSWSWVGDHTFIEDKVLSKSKSITTNCKGRGW